MRSKIQGLVYKKDQEEDLQLIKLKEKLPISVNQLNFLLINVCSILLELVDRKNVMFPPITLDTIYVSKLANFGIPFIKSYVNQQIPEGQRQQHALNSIITILKQLGYNQIIIQLQTMDLQKIQDWLLNQIAYKKHEAIRFTKIFQQYLGVNSIEQAHIQDPVCQVDIIGTPPFIYNVNEDQIVMKTYVQQQIYQSREVEIIEEFDNPHQPYLYSYIRYSNLLILFLKQHKFSFYKLISDCIGPRKGVDFQQQKVYQGYLKIFYSMVNSLEVLHKQGIVHRDLKPQNNMFDYQNELKNLDDLLQHDITCVIIDYDRSKKVDSENKQTKYECNEIYCPPEGTQDKYNSSYDIWQLGFIWLLQLKKEVVLIGKLASIDEITTILELKKKQQNSLNLEDKRKNYDIFFEAALKIQEYVEIDEALHQMIKKMMSFNPTDRPKLAEIKELIENLIQINN